MHLFAHWFDDNAEISTFLETIDAAKGNPAQRAAMRFSYTKSKELTTRALKRSAQGLGDESIDEPLPPEHQRDLLARANTLYRWGVIDSRQICCDMQLAKIRREFQNCQPSMLQGGKVRTLAQSQRQAAPKCSLVTLACVADGNGRTDPCQHCWMNESSMCCNRCKVCVCAVCACQQCVYLEEIGLEHCGCCRGCCPNSHKASPPGAS